MNTQITSEVLFIQVQIQSHSHSHEWARQIAEDYLAAFKSGDAPAYPQALDQFPGLQAAYNNTLYWCGLVGFSKCSQECQQLVHAIQATGLSNSLLP